jgi:hypothetical protein
MNPKPTFHSVNCYMATNGDIIPADSPVAYTYTGPSNVRDTATITSLASGHRYTKTYTFSGANIVGDSGWVMQ